MFSFILKKPIFFDFLLCLLFLITAGIFFGHSLFSIEAVHYILLSVILILCSINGLFRYISILFAFIFLLLFLLFQLPILLLFGELGLTSFICWQRKEEKNICTFFILTASFLLHLYYIHLTPVDVRQHDFRAILFYMQKIIENGINFIQFNPWHLYYFFHQPLHFLIMGYVYFGEIKVFFSTALAGEGIQYISLFYVTASSIVSYALLNRLFTDKKNTYIALILFSFNPTLFLFSGYISDDVPLLLFSLVSLLYFIHWQQTKQLRFIIFAALFFGLASLTKLSVFLLVPAICFLFAAELFLPFKRTILNHICIFVIIAVPLSLIWIVRNHVLYDMPFYNIPDTSPLGQNFRNISLLDRLTDFSSLLIPFLDAPYHVDANILLAIVKTELFGEWTPVKLFSFTYFIGLFLYLLNIIIHCATFVAACFALSCHKAKRHVVLLLFFAIIYFTVFLYSFKYALDYPYVCSVDYRLIAIMLLPSIILLTSTLPKKWQRYYLFLSSLYALLSTTFYLLIL